MRQLQTIPGVGPSIARDLMELGFRNVEELRDHDPEMMYDNLIALKGVHVDRCMLYVFRCAVYFASNETHEPAKLKWWNWKDNPDHEQEERTCTSVRK